MKAFQKLLCLIFATAAYMIVGAAVFKVLERQQLDHVAILRNMTNKLREELAKNYNMTSDAFDKLLYEVREIFLKEMNANETEWTFYSSLYFVGSVITTIGYGHLSPRSDSGRLFLVFYATVGIPLCVITLKEIGNHINSLTAICIRCFERKLLNREAQGIKIKQMIIAALLMVLELMVGGLMYYVTESWNYISSVYYCFVVFSTIGFGDLVPNQGRAPSGNFQIFMMLVRAAVLILGLSTLSSLLSAVIQGIHDINMVLPKFCCKPNRVESTARDQDDQSRALKLLDITNQHDQGTLESREQKNPNNLAANENQGRSHCTSETRDQLDTETKFSRDHITPRGSCILDNMARDRSFITNNLSCASNTEPHALSISPARDNFMNNTWDSDNRTLSPAAMTFSGTLPYTQFLSGRHLLHKQNSVNALLSRDQHFALARLTPISRDSQITRSRHQGTTDSPIMLHAPGMTMGYAKPLVNITPASDLPAPGTASTLEPVTNGNAGSFTADMSPLPAPSSSELCTSTSLKSTSDVLAPNVNQISITSSSNVQPAPITMSKLPSITSSTSTSNYLVEIPSVVSLCSSSDVTAPSASPSSI